MLIYIYVFFFFLQVFMSEAQINWFKKLMEASTFNEKDRIYLGLVKFRSLYFSPNFKGRIFFDFFFDKYSKKYNSKLQIYY